MMSDMIDDDVDIGGGDDDVEADCGGGVASWVADGGRLCLSCCVDDRVTNSRFKLGETVSSFYTSYSRSSCLHKVASRATLRPLVLRSSIALGRGLGAIRDKHKQVCATITLS